MVFNRYSLTGYFLIAFFWVEIGSFMFGFTVYRGSFAEGGITDY